MPSLMLKVILLAISIILIAPVAYSAAPVIDLSKSSGSGGRADPDSIEGRLARIERMLDSQTLVEMTLRLESMQQEMQQMFGELEVISHDITSLKRRQRDLYLDIDNRFKKLESQSMGVDTGASANSSQAANNNTQKGTPGSDKSNLAQDGSEEPVILDEEQLQKKAYQSAFNLLREGKYDSAKSQFASFIKSYPKSEYADNAQYWLGEVNYVLRDFNGALVEFNKVLTVYPDSSKYADALLKIGLSQYELEQWSQASKSFNEIIKKFPKSSAAQLAEKRLNKIKLK